MLFFTGAEYAGLIEKASVSDSDVRYQFRLVIFYVFILIFVIAMQRSLWQTEPIKVFDFINYQ